MARLFSIHVIWCKSNMNSYRRVRVDGYSVALACSLFALSRPLLRSQGCLGETGVAGLLPEPTGPRRGSQVNGADPRRNAPEGLDHVVCTVGRVVTAAHQLSVHPRSIERATCPFEKKGRAS